MQDSPERGFELALFYAVTHDRERGREAVNWGLAHVCERRQLSLISDWVGELASPDQQKILRTVACAYNGRILPVALGLRDSLFEAIINGLTDPAQFEVSNKRLIDDLSEARTLDPADLYAAVEYMMAMRNLMRADLRESDPHFFSLLPKEFLLSLTPQQVEHPDWMPHIAALALVTLDPNLENAQFLQGWAMENRQMLPDGPGVAYEFLWADPYLPGIAYQNMDPWIYDPAGRLFARTDWDPTSCWASITAAGAKFGACSQDQHPAFGSLRLLRVNSTCLTVPGRESRETTILWNLKPHAQLTYGHVRQQVHGQADPAGLWPVPNDTAGKVCLESQGRR